MLNMCSAKFGGFFCVFWVDVCYVLWLWLSVEKVILFFVLVVMYIYFRMYGVCVGVINVLAVCFTYIEIVYQHNNTNAYLSLLVLNVCSYSKWLMNILASVLDMGDLSEDLWFVILHEIVLFSDYLCAWLCVCVCVFVCLGFIIILYPLI